MIINTDSQVIGKQRGSFKRVFESAQIQLRTKFGMEMVELPVREKTTMKEKRGLSLSRYSVDELIRSSCAEVKREFEEFVLLHPHNDPTYRIPHA